MAASVTSEWDIRLHTPFTESGQLPTMESVTVMLTAAGFRGVRIIRRRDQRLCREVLIAAELRCDRMATEATRQAAITTAVAPLTKLCNLRCGTGKIYSWLPGRPYTTLEVWAVLGPGLLRR